MTTLGVVTATDELNCPLCDYDLRGLPEHRCPECGHAFDPDELRRARREKRAWLFEHAPARVVRAWLKTSLVTLWPHRFWKRVAAAHVIVPGRLNAFAISWLTLAVMLTLASIIVATTLARSDLFAQRMVVGSTGYWQSAADPGATWLEVFFGQLRRRGVPTSLLPVLVLCLWPLTVNFAVRLFGTTLRRANIDQGHLTRVSSYSLPAVFAAPILMAVIVEIDLDQYLPDVIDGFLLKAIPPVVFMFLRAIGVGVLLGIGLVVACLWSGWHLIAAHVRYLRVPHAFAQALLVHAIAWLSILAVLGTISGATRR